MKICAIISEYNPLHNGHLYHIREAKRLSGADAIVCLMSGNFVQRGEAAVLDKYTRARHALLSGADAVIELPVPFATSSAELFASGGVKLLAAIPSVSALSFGAESGTADEFLLAARALNNEPDAVSKRIRAFLDNGMSYVKARAAAWEQERSFSTELLLSQNNILGTEYARAILKYAPSIALCPVKRVGDGYGETALSACPSSTAVRAAIQRGERVTEGVPPYVAAELPNSLSDCSEVLEKLALLKKSAAEIKETLDCGEGLEFALKNAATENVSGIPETLASKRYTASRIRRILLQNLLGIEKSLIKECLDSPPYLRVLAIRREREDVLAALAESALPLLVRAGDREKLSDSAKRCLETEDTADGIFRLIKGLKKEKQTVFMQ